jgi:hypothetical protein
MVNKWESGYTSANAQWAGFIEKLIPPEKREEKSITKEEKIETGKTKRWYLEQGDKEYAEKLYERALRYYEKVLEEDKENPGAKVRVKSAKSRYYVQQGDLDYSNNDFSSAFEYYVMAFAIADEGYFDPAEKVINLWEKDKAFYDKVKDYDLELNGKLLSQDMIVEANIKLCEKLLSENKLNQAAALLTIISKYAASLEIKNQSDQLIRDLTAKEVTAAIAEDKIPLILAKINTLLDEGNLYQATYFLKEFEKNPLPESFQQDVAGLQNKLAEKQSEIDQKTETEKVEDRINQLKKQAQEFAQLNKFDKAIKCYLEITEIEPGKTEHMEALKNLQLEKFKFDKFQEEIKSKLNRDNFILYGNDRFKDELYQDALDYYIKAYKEFPEQGKAIFGILQVLEKCKPEDARFLTAELLEKKITKFTSDVLEVIRNQYLGKNDETGLTVLGCFYYLQESSEKQPLEQEFKTNLHRNYLQQAIVALDQAKFTDCLNWLNKSGLYGESPELSQQLAICEYILHIEKLVDEENYKEAANLLKTLPSKDQMRIIHGLLDLSAVYLEKENIKAAKFIYKKMSSYDSHAKIKDRIETLKAKEKELKKSK